MEHHAIICTFYLHCEASTIFLQESFIGMQPRVTEVRLLSWGPLTSPSEYDTYSVVLLYRIYSPSHTPQTLYPWSQTNRTHFRIRNLGILTQMALRKQLILWSYCHFYCHLCNYHEHYAINIYVLFVYHIINILLYQNQIRSVHQV